MLFAVGVGLLAASTAYGAYDRYFNQEQSGWQALLGGAADATGISGIYTGITGRDLATQHHLSLTPAQQRQMLTEGSIQVVGSALVLYGGVRSFLRGRVPVAPRIPQGQWRTVNEAMSARARAYQQQITGRAGESYVVNGVKFDGVNAGGLVDAKGPGYATFVRNGEFRGFFQGQRALLEQARRQVAAANGAPITWHVAEADAVSAIRNLFANAKPPITGITVVHTPPVP